MDRRDFIKTAALSSLYINYHCPLWANASLSDLDEQTLILIELKGGNDGLNTFIPFEDRYYYRLRPRLGLKENLLKVNDKHALHPNLKYLHQLWKKGNLSIIQGVGYKKPNLSHFRSIDIWNTASESDEYLSRGWLYPICQTDTNKERISKGLVIGNADPGPLSECPFVVFDRNNGKQHPKNSNQSIVKKSRSNSNLSHILKTQQSSIHATRTIENLNLNQRNFRSLSRAAGSIVKLIRSRERPKVIKVTQGGYDTHANQLGPHGNLLKQLDGFIENLTVELKKHQLFDQSLIMTYSEFGRRAGENQSRGTDHGTANVHFAIGGKVKGGVYGRSPSLKKLEKSNLVYSTDFKRMYQTIIKKWWQLPDDTLFKKPPSPLNFL